MVCEVDNFKFVFEVPDNFLLSANDFEDIAFLVKQCIGTVKKTDSERLIVLETWFIVDYFVKIALASAMDIEQYKCEKYDPMNELLPSSLSSCVSMFEKLLYTQRELPRKTTLDKDMVFSMKFYKFLGEKYPEIKTGLEQAEKEYSSVKIGNTIDNALFLDNLHYVYQNEKWVNSYSHINDEWFKNIRKFNKFRNSMAHRVNFDKEMDEFQKSIENLRTHCLNFIFDTFGLKVYSE